jgi:hypothetical protein
MQIGDSDEHLESASGSTRKIGTRFECHSGVEKVGGVVYGLLRVDDNLTPWALAFPTRP